jgi:hypothetical protein
MFTIQKHVPIFAFGTTGQEHSVHWNDGHGDVQVCICATKERAEWVAESLNFLHSLGDAKTPDELWDYLMNNLDKVGAE